MKLNAHEGVIPTSSLNVLWLLQSPQVTFLEEGALGLSTFNSVQLIVTRVLGYLKKHFGKCLFTSSLDGHVMRTSLNTWYNIVIHVVKIFDTEDWEMENKSAICFCSKSKRRRTSTITNS